MTENDKKDPPSFWSVIAESFIEREKDALRFAIAGAIVGALVGVGLGLYFFDIFGLIGAGVGLTTGAATGGIATWLFYQLAWPAILKCAQPTVSTLTSRKVYAKSPVF